MRFQANKPAIQALFDGVSDPRVVGRNQFSISELLFLVCLARTFGFRSGHEIEKFGKKEADWLRTFFEYECGLPSHDTLTRCKYFVKESEFELIYSSFCKLIHADSAEK
jgi:DDE_Tnp_1-associated